MSTKEFLIVFDVNGTLLKRVNKTETGLIKRLKEANIQQVHEDNYFHYYIRTHIGLLNEFLIKNKIEFVFWSTMYESNLLRTLNVLYKFGFKDHLEDNFCRDHCKVGKTKGKIKASKWVKDLSIPANYYGYKVENCVLIDDDFEKVYNDNNYFLVKEFDPLVEDDEILRIIEFIKQFTGIN